MGRYCDKKTFHPVTQIKAKHEAKHVITKCSLHAATVWKGDRYNTVIWLKYCV